MGHAKSRDKRLLQFAREERKAPTLSEAQLWHELRNKKLDGLKFRREHIVEPFILDFYCDDHRLAIEIDGYAHDSEEQQRKDKWRDDELAKKNIRVLRFRVDHVMHDMENVLKEIREACSTPQPWKK